MLVEQLLALYALRACKGWTNLSHRSRRGQLSTDQHIVVRLKLAFIRVYFVVCKEGGNMLGVLVKSSLQILLNASCGDLQCLSSHIFIQIGW